MNINTVATHLFEYETQQNPNAPIYDAVGTLDQGGQFDYRVMSSLNYQFSGGATLGLT